MGWLGKGKNTNKGKQAGEGASQKSSDDQTSNAKGQRPADPKQSKSTDIRAQALANAKAARERLGEETIQKIAEALRKKQNSPLEQAKAKIAKITEDDATRVAEEILSMLETRH